MVIEKPSSISKADCFYELYLYIEDHVEFSDDEKYLLGLGQLALESNQLEMQMAWLNGLSASLGNRMLLTMEKVTQLGIEKLFQREESVSSSRIEKYWSFKEWLQQLNS